MARREEAKEAVQDAVNLVWNAGRAEGLREGESSLRMLAAIKPRGTTKARLLADLAREANVLAERARKLEQGE